MLTSNETQASGPEELGSHWVMALVVFSASAVIVPAIVIYALISWALRRMASPVHSAA